jgi:hypothetical protein
MRTVRFWEMDFNFSQIIYEVVRDSSNVKKCMNLIKAGYQSM